MSDQQEDEREILARLTPRALQFGTDVVAIQQWLATLTERERDVMMAWAQRQGSHFAQAAERVDDVFKRISKDLRG